MQAHDPEIERMGRSQEDMGKARGVVAQDQRIIDRRPPELVRRGEADRCRTRVEAQRGLPRVEHPVRTVSEALRMIDFLRI